MSKTPAAPPPGDRPVPTAPPPPPAWRHWLWLLWLALILIWIVPSFIHTTQRTSLTYSQFSSDVTAHKVKTVNIPSPASADANVTVTGTLKDGTQFTAVTPPIAGTPLADSLRTAGVAVSYQAPGSSIGGLLLNLLIFI
ncbi:MAG: ATP-dependent metallopeptidase FtsH/Yme1/Tma family protein, partial [Actinobacteria bacterium]|nr:ATP-dependent metallopeptidase FtsH/Yme1/Tma family protein [Actinomycetota bacterium]